MTKRTPDAERLHQARKAAAVELRLDPKDWRVRRYAVLLMQFENVEALLASGAESDADKLVKLDSAMQEIRATVPPEPMKVEVVYCETITGICPACNARIEDYVAPPTPSGPPRTLDLDAEVVKPEPNVETFRHLPPPVEAKPEPPHPNTLPRRNPGSIHDAPPRAHDAARLQRHQAQWRRERRLVPRGHVCPILAHPSDVGGIQWRSKANSR